MKRFTFLFLAIVSIVGIIAISGCERPETYTVTFNANGGTGTMSIQTFTENEAQALTRNAFTYEGYTFIGWNTMQNGCGASYNDGQSITATADMTLYAQWTSNDTSQTPEPTPQPTTGILDGHVWVDLGLPSGRLWATCNVGSDTPEGYGNYYAWGETSPKDVYDWTTYCFGNETNLTKYCDSAFYGYDWYTDTLTILEAIDDAATANWGDGWRMPTHEDLLELLFNCTSRDTIYNEVFGHIVTGPNGNSIFMPAAGYRFENNLHMIGYRGNYWSCSLCTNGGAGSAWDITFESNGCYMGSGDSRCWGRSVRPVVAQ